MRVPRLSLISALAAAGLLLGACTGGGSASPAGGGPTASPGGGGGAPSGAPTAASGGGGGGGGGNAGSLNACTLLTTDEIQAAVGWPVKAGVVQSTDSQTDCEWDAQASDGGTVGLTISNYDDMLWQAGSSAGISKAVSGIGDAAFKGWPHAGDLTIKVKGYQVAVAIIDFATAADKVDAETLSLAKLVLPRL